MNTITVSNAADVMRLAREMIDDAGEGESVKERLRSAARHLGIDYGLAKRIRHNEIKEVRAHIFLRMADRYAAVLTRLEEQSNENARRYRERLQNWVVTRENSAAADGVADPPLDR